MIARSIGFAAYAFTVTSGILASHTCSALVDRVVYSSTLTVTALYAGFAGILASAAHVFSRGANCLIISLNIDALTSIFAAISRGSTTVAILGNRGQVLKPSRVGIH